MAITFITPVDVTPGTTGVWTDIDCSSYIPVNATGVIIHHANINNNANYDWIGWRKNGSTDNRSRNIDGHMWYSIGVSAQIFEIISSSNVKTWLIGYYTDESVFFTNAIDKSVGATGAWTDINISGDTGADTAIAAHFDIIAGDWSYAIGLRKNGSTDNRHERYNRHIGATIGVDASEICEAYVNNTAQTIHLVGYSKSGFSMDTNGTNVSPASTGIWTDLTALPANSIAGVYEIHGGNFGNDYGLRKNGTSENITANSSSWDNDKRFPIVACDTSQIVEGYIGHSSFQIWKIGSVTAVPTYDAITCTESISVQLATTNIALNKSVTASSTKDANHPASAAVDGSMSTYWSSQYSDPQWITVDLGDIYSLSRVILKWETAYGKKYNINTSLDNSAFDTAYSVSASDGGTDDIFLPDGTTTRYLRVYGTERGTSWGYALWELEVYGATASFTGSDCTITAGSATTVTGSTTGIWYNIDMTRQIDEWINYPTSSPNYGVLLKTTSETNDTFVSFASSEHTTIPIRPSVTIQYKPPYVQFVPTITNLSVWASEDISVQESLSGTGSNILIPNAPTNVSVTQGAGSYSVDIMWDAPTTSNPYNGYKIYRKKESDSDWTQIGIVSNYTLLFQDSSPMSTDASYYWKVRTFSDNPTAESSDSDIANLITNPDAPDILDITYSSTGNTLSWDASTDNITGYEIERSINGVTFELLTTTTSTTYADTDITRGITYTYRVRAYDDGGEG